MDDCQGNSVSLQVTREEKDLGIWTDPSFKFSVHVDYAAKKAHQILGLIRRSFIFLDISLMKQLYTIVSWCVLIWNTVIMLAGTLSSKSIWNYWKQFSIEQLRCFQVYAISVTKKDHVVWTYHLCYIVD